MTQQELLNLLAPAGLVLFGLIWALIDLQKQITEIKRRMEEQEEGTP